MKTIKVRFDIGDVVCYQVNGIVKYDTVEYVRIDARNNSNTIKYGLNTGEILEQHLFKNVNELCASIRKQANDAYGDLRLKIAHNRA